ncbi:YcjX family protein [Pannonibacter sp.]|uniref:YcjX family protein n=1 Tax=Pannonibacter sp. TaxID=1906786 RepID=UPI003F6E7C72
MKLSSLADDALLALENLAGTAGDLGVPSLRIGVTGLARAGKTVFITALVHNLLHGGRLPLFDAAAGRRISATSLQPQPDDAVPRFDYEAHVAALVNERVWPQSTRQVSELRLTVKYESASFLTRTLGRGKLHLDIVDYPGEWLLDLPLLSKDYRSFSDEALRLARAPGRTALARDYLAALQATDPATPENETDARALARAFTGYLAGCRADEHALSMLPPGRFLMPGDLDGSPALTFAPLDLSGHPGAAGPSSLLAMMERRFEAYKKHVVRPFFHDHFARLDRQIVLVDALQALNAGPAALRDLETALGQVLTSFRPGRSSWLSSILTRRIDRILFAATKADHLHRDDHDRLEAILRRLVARGIEHAQFRGAEVEVLALAAVRATREATVRHAGEDLPAILGTPLPGEAVNGDRYDGQTEIAMFPGDLPQEADSLFQALESESSPAAVDSESELQRLQEKEKHQTGLRFVRFRPPALERTAEGLTLSLPHIRLDRAINFLIGDRLA